MAFKGPCGAAPATPQTNGLEEGDAGARPQVEKVVLRVLRDGLALVAVVVHVEAGTPGIGKIFGINIAGESHIQKLWSLNTWRHDTEKGLIFLAYMVYITKPLCTP